MRRHSDTETKSENNKIILTMACENYHMCKIIEQFEVLRVYTYQQSINFIIILL